MCQKTCRTKYFSLVIILMLINLYLIEVIECGSVFKVAKKLKKLKKLLPLLLLSPKVLVIKSREHHQPTYASYPTPELYYAPPCCPEYPKHNHYEKGNFHYHQHHRNAYSNEYDK